MAPDLRLETELDPLQRRFARHHRDERIGIELLLADPRLRRGSRVQALAAPELVDRTLDELGARAEPEPRAELVRERAKQRALDRVRVELFVALDAELVEQPRRIATRVDLDALLAHPRERVLPEIGALERVGHALRLGLLRRC